MPIAIGDLKECAVCREVKPVDAYGRWVKAKDGLNSRCKKCSALEQRLYRVNNHERLSVNKKAEYARNRERRLANSRNWKTANKERHSFLQWRSWLKTQYGITPEAYDAILKAQGGTCALCPSTESTGGRKLAVDHDHNCCPGKKTCGKCVRGLLCTPCNRNLGWFELRAELVDRYLALHSTIGS
jgi:recombination endonuclease VII